MPGDTPEIRPTPGHVRTADDTALNVLGQSSGRLASSRRVFSDILSGTDHSPVRSLYIHVPFCFHKCHYCDFYSFVDTRDRQGVFAQRLARELSAISPLTRGEPLRTIFIGGGTPTLLAPEHWKLLLATLRERFDLSLMGTSGGEWTVECNPETASSELFDLLMAEGVNRLSFGAQSFNPVHLKTLERWHDPDSVGRAIELARASGIERCSVDLIQAIPGQTLEDVESDLNAAISLGVEHVSAYTLTYEPNTAMTVRMRRGEFEPADEETEAVMFEKTRDFLAASGFERYEVSNHAKRGKECLHNLAYWRSEDWLAAGPSASGHIAGRRFKVVPRLGDYLEMDDEGFAPIVDYEPPDPARSLAELIMTGIRLREGLDLDRIRTVADGVSDGCFVAILEEANVWISSGNAIRTESRLRLTEPGMLLADRIAAELMSAVG